MHVYNGEHWEENDCTNFLSNHVYPFLLYFAFHLRSNEVQVENGNEIAHECPGKTLETHPDSIIKENARVFFNGVRAWACIPSNKKQIVARIRQTLYEYTTTLH